MRLLPYARLLRIPNVFTALADVALGMCVALSATSTIAGSGFLQRAALLFLASGLLYCAGMVWNDYFDIEQDRRERPFRPLPSGAVSRQTALLLALVLTAAGWSCAALSGFDRDRWHPNGAAVGAVLVAAILLYDGWLKRTPLGPIAMGLCRFLNVLLALTLAPDGVSLPTRLHFAGAVGVYIVGVTWFARTEAKASNARELRAAALLMLLGLFLGLAVATHVEPGVPSPLFPYLLIAFGFAIGLPVAAAIQQPTPERVQRAVKRCVLGLIAFDAILATAFVGTAGLLILLLLPPALLLGKWVYST